MTPWVQLGCRVFHIIVSKPKNDLTDIFCIWFLSSCFVNILLWGKILFLSIFFFLKIIFFEKKLCLFFLLSLQLCWIKLSGKYLLPDYRGVNAIDLLPFFVIVLRLNTYYAIFSWQKPKASTSSATLSQLSRLVLLHRSWIATTYIAISRGTILSVLQKPLVCLVVPRNDSTVRCSTS